MLEALKTSETISAIAAAFAAAQAEFKVVEKGHANPFHKNLYENIDDILVMLRPVLAKHGLAFLQPATTAPGGLSVTCILMHKSGEWLSSSMEFKPKDLSPQSVGSAITYGRRYTAKSFLGIACAISEDDDGNAATAPVPAQKTSWKLDKGNRAHIARATQWAAERNLEASLVGPLLERAHGKEFSDAETLAAVLLDAWETTL